MNHIFNRVVDTQEYSSALKLSPSVGALWRSLGVNELRKSFFYLANILHKSLVFSQLSLLLAFIEVYIPV